MNTKIYLATTITKPNLTSLKLQLLISWYPRGFNIIPITAVDETPNRFKYGGS